VKQLRLNHMILKDTCPSYLKNNLVKINEHHKHKIKLF